jgi:hypothetical protein
MYSASLAHAKVPVTWEATMPRTDLLGQSARRVELDQRSREARLRLEHIERLLILRRLPRQSLLRRVLRCLGARTYFGGPIAGQSANRTITSGRSRGRRGITKETGSASGGLSTAPPVSWPNSSKCGVLNTIASRSVEMADPQKMRHRLKPWDHACRRGDGGIPFLSDGRF